MTAPRRVFVLDDERTFPDHENAQFFHAQTNEQAIFFLEDAVFAINEIWLDYDLSQCDRAYPTSVRTAQWLAFHRRAIPPVRIISNLDFGRNELKRILPRATLSNIGYRWDFAHHGIFDDPTDSVLTPAEYALLGERVVTVPLDRAITRMFALQRAAQLTPEENARIAAIGSAYRGVMESYRDEDVKEASICLPAGESGVVDVQTFRAHLDEALNTIEGTLKLRETVLAQERSVEAQRFLADHPDTGLYLATYHNGATPLLAFSEEGAQLQATARESDQGGSLMDVRLVRTATISDVARTLAKRRCDVNELGAEIAGAQPRMQARTLTPDRERVAERSR